MSDDSLNMSMRKFLKNVGVTSQQRIETAIRDAKAAGKLTGGTVRARAVVTLEGLDMEHVVEGEISLADDGDA